jgi:hypothetical protein
VLLPDIVDVVLFQFLPARLRQEQPRTPVVRVTQQVLEQNPAKYVIQR